MYRFVLVLGWLLGVMFLELDHRIDNKTGDNCSSDKKKNHNNLRVLQKLSILLSNTHKCQSPNNL